MRYLFGTLGPALTKNSDVGCSGPFANLTSTPPIPRLALDWGSRSASGWQSRLVVQSNVEMLNRESILCYVWIRSDGSGRSTTMPRKLKPVKFFPSTESSGNCGFLTGHELTVGESIFFRQTHFFRRARTKVNWLERK